MESIPLLYRNRELTFDPDMLEKIKYLTFKSGVGRFEKKRFYSTIVNNALKEFLEVEFKKLKLQHYIDPNYEAEKIRFEKRYQESIKQVEAEKLRTLARIKILDNSIERIKELERKRIEEKEKELGKNKGKIS